MTKYREILRLNALGINKTGIAASIGCSRKTVRDTINLAAEAGVKWPLEQSVTDKDLETILFPTKHHQTPSRKYPDYGYIEKELLRDGVTLKLLWNEYCEDCKKANVLPLMYSQFCFHFQKHAEQKRATMHITRKPGEQTEVDWAGSPVYIVDRNTGDLTPCYIFVGVLNYSLYTYAEAFLSMNLDSWIAAHVNMYSFFGGSTKILTPDNLRTGVDKSDWYTPEINKTYREMAEHYNTAVIPARIKSPKDKASAENAVSTVFRWIAAAIRNERYFTVAELNGEIRKRLESYNRTPFQKKEGSRHSVFFENEKVFMTPLPQDAYELSQWKKATVQFNYHIAVEKMMYSVPFEYIRQKVDVRVTRNIIEVFYNNNRVCSHKRLYGHAGQYSTVMAHMPADHQRYMQWDAKRFAGWAEKIGPCAVITIKSILASFKVEQQGYKSCMGLLKLADKYSVSRLEAACKKALSYTPHPSYKSIKNILLTGQDKQTLDEPPTKGASPDAYGYTRGAGYYGGKRP